MGKNKCPKDLKWNWQRVMDWYGGEGNVHVKPPDRYIQIAQQDRKVLDKICDFVKTQGIKVCSFYYDEPKRLHYM